MCKNRSVAHREVIDPRNPPFAGKSAKGTWTLTIQDAAATDSGTLVPFAMALSFTHSDRLTRAPRTASPKEVSLRRRGKLSPPERVRLVRGGPDKKGRGGRPRLRRAMAEQEVDKSKLAPSSPRVPSSGARARGSDSVGRGLLSQHLRNEIAPHTDRSLCCRPVVDEHLDERPHDRELGRVAADVMGDYRASRLDQTLR